jgi:uncharacterized protein (DUF2225 family)
LYPIRAIQVQRLGISIWIESESRAHSKLAVKNETTLDPVFGNVIYPFIILIMSCIVSVFLNLKQTAENIVSTIKKETRPDRPWPD